MPITLRRLQELMPDIGFRSFHVEQEQGLVVIESRNVRTGISMIIGAALFGLIPLSFFPFYFVIDAVILGFAVLIAIAGVVETIRVLRVELDSRTRRGVVRLGKVVGIELARFDFDDVDHLEVSRIFQEHLLGYQPLLDNLIHWTTDLWLLTAVMRSGEVVKLVRAKPGPIALLAEIIRTNLEADLVDYSGGEVEIIPPDAPLFGSDEVVGHKTRRRIGSYFTKHPAVQIGKTLFTKTEKKEERMIRYEKTRWNLEDIMKSLVPFMTALLLFRIEIWIIGEDASEMVYGIILGNVTWQWSYFWAVAIFVGFGFVQRPLLYRGALLLLGQKVTMIDEEGLFHGYYLKGAKMGTVLPYYMLQDRLIRVVPRKAMAVVQGAWNRSKRIWSLEIVGLGKRHWIGAFHTKNEAEGFFSQLHDKMDLRLLEQQKAAEKDFEAVPKTGPGGEEEEVVANVRRAKNGKQGDF